MLKTSAVAGGLTAAAVIARLGERITVAVGLTMIALGLLTTATTSLVLIGIGVLATGVGVPWALVAFVTTRQRLTPATLQGRASAASSMAFNVPQTAATMLAAVVILAVDYRIMIVVTCAAVLVAAAACLPLPEEVLPAPDVEAVPGPEMEAVSVPAVTPTRASDPGAPRSAASGR
jgi:MFS family permease